MLVDLGKELLEFAVHEEGKSLYEPLAGRRH
jgi:hypothetical protein